MVNAIFFRAFETGVWNSFIQSILQDIWSPGCRWQFVTILTAQSLNNCKAFYKQRNNLFKASSENKMQTGHQSAELVMPVPVDNVPSSVTVTTWLVEPECDRLFGILVNVKTDLFI